MSSLAFAVAAWQQIVFHFTGVSAAWTLVPHYLVFALFVGVSEIRALGSSLGFSDIWGMVCWFSRYRGLAACAIPDC